MMQGRTVSARIAVGLARTLATLGLPEAPLFARIGPALETASDPDARVPLDVLYDLWEHAASTRDDPALPIDVTRRVRTPPTADVFTFVIQTSPTVLAALEAGNRYLAMRATSFQLELVRDGDRVFWVQYRLASPRLGRRLAIEATLSELVALMRVHLAPSFAPLGVHIAHARPRDVRPHEAFFRCPVHFGATRDALELDPADLTRPMPKGDPALAAYFNDRCREALAPFRHEEDLLEQVRGRVARALPSVLTIDSVARDLALSERTLRRRLRERGGSFDAVVSSTRVALAEQHLAQRRLSLGEIAYLVGFSEPSAFHRFFKRQTGKTPAERRAAARAST